MKLRKNQPPAIMSEEEIDALAVEIAQSEPAYHIGRRLIDSLCGATGMDEGMAVSMLMEGGGMPTGIAAISARAANDLVRLKAEGALEGMPEDYLNDAAFAKLLLEMPAKAALRLYRAERGAEERARREREAGAMDIMEKLAARRAMPQPIRADAPAAADTDYANMSSEEFRRLKERLNKAVSDGRRARL